MIECVLPRAVQLVVDDVGWREGWRTDAEGGPYRAGIERLLGPDDYRAIAEVGRRLGIRPTAAMILCEWDTGDVCASQPSCTAAGATWSNRHRLGPWLEESAAIFREQADHLELAMHGVGHEHWQDGRPTRAEWYSLTAGKWPWEDLLGHLRVFRAILDQHGLGPAAGSRLPVDFVPCAFHCLLDDADPQSTGALMAGAGVRYGSTPFSSLDRRSALLAADGAVDHGVLLIDRGNSGVPWYAVDGVPSEVHGTPAAGPAAAGSICGIHWPNLLAEDPANNDRAVGHWVDYLRRVDAVPGQYLAGNAREAFAQWGICTFGKLRCDGTTLHLDLSGVPAAAREATGDLPAVVEVRGDAALRPLDASAVLWTRSLPGRSLVAVRPGADGRARLALERGTAAATAAAPTRQGTGNLLDLRRQAGCVEVDIEVYRRQRLTLPLAARPLDCEISRGGLRLEAWQATPDGRGVEIDLAGTDIQGEEGTVRLRIENA